MTKAEFKEAVLRTMSEHDIDESNVVVDDFLNDLVIGLEYDVGFEFEEDETEEAAPGLGQDDD
jgi:hypothetical protein